MAPGQTTFSVGFLFRAVTCVGLLLGWVAMIRDTAPLVVLAVVSVLGFLLGCVVTVRRQTSSWRRLQLAFNFYLGTCFLAFYSASLANAWQQYRSRGKPRGDVFDAIDSFGHVGTLLLLAPFAMGTLIYMLRSWTWSAHDHFGDD